MDVEKKRRAELIEALGSDFLCFEEVKLRHPFMTKYCVRADVVAIPTQEDFWGFPIAFEVKEPDGKYRNTAGWIQALRQASDYVYAAIEPQKGREDLNSISRTQNCGVISVSSATLCAEQSRDRPIRR